MRVLAIGSTGQFAGMVLPALVDQGLKVRALVHDPAKAQRLADTGVDETVAGDLRDPGSMRSALQGVDGVFLIIPAFAAAVDLDPADALAAMPDGFERDGLTAMFDDYTKYGFRGGNNLVLRTILGRVPRSLDDFFAELAH